jgi:hypothetical protein
MKRLTIISCLFSLFSITSCSEDYETSSPKIPLCVLDKIEQIKAQPKWNPVATVNEYIYQGKRVFLFSSDCCDQYNKLYDANCNYLCSPSGGFSGGGDLQCMDFFNTSVFVREVWKDPR